MNKIVFLSGTRQATKAMADYTMRQLLRMTERGYLIYIEDASEGVGRIAQNYLALINYPHYAVSEPQAWYAMAELAHKGIFIEPDDDEMPGYMYDRGKELHVVNFEGNKPGVRSWNRA